MPDNKKLKLALVTTTLSDGGAERCAALLSEYFDNQNVEVHNIVFSGRIQYRYAGKLVHLIADNQSNSSIARFFRLKKYLAKEKFDFIIDFRTKEKLWQEAIIHRFLYKNHIQTIHSSKLETYIPKSYFFKKLLYKKNTPLVAVCKAVENKIREQQYFNSVKTIYNPIATSVVDIPIVKDENFILAAGSMNKNIKQFDVLIQAYSQSILPEKNIKLVIIGDGLLRPTWQKLVQEMGLQDRVVLKGFIENPMGYFKNALFTVLTSKYEGFGYVLVEALALGTPVVSYDCPFGPSEIINHQQNGLLVANQNREELVKALNEMIENQELYTFCKSNAKASVEKFSLQRIGAEWITYFDTIKNM